MRRGHFIVDRAKERDGQTDRLWITSQNEGGVGTELTVARNEGVTVAGTSASMDQKSARAAGDGKGESENEKSEALAAAISGTTGKIAKFISATDLGDSVMTELNGSIGVGTLSPGTKLAVQTPTSSYGISHTDGEAVLTTFVGTGNSTATKGGWLGTLSNYDLRFFTANGPSRMTITASGNIGIGTVAPIGKLDVIGKSSSTATPKPNFPQSKMSRFLMEMSLWLKDAALKLMRAQMVAEYLVSAAIPMMTRFSCLDTTAIKQGARMECGLLEKMAGSFQYYR